MADDATNARITSWFRAAGFAGLILPDGWFGRPFDNQHRLTHVLRRGDKLLVELDDRLWLTFTGSATTARVEQGELVITDFLQCVFDWQEYGAVQPHATVYASGAVKFVPPPGVKIE